MNTDPISDCLTRIRNAQGAHHETVSMPHSYLKEALTKVLYEEGFLGSFKVLEKENGRKELLISLRYDAKKKPFITQMTRNSRPGRRMYLQAKNIRSVRNGMGIAIFSTPKGLMTDRQAKEEKVGGELMCTVW